MAHILGPTKVTDLAVGDVISLKEGRYRIDDVCEVKDATGDARLLYLVHQHQDYYTQRTLSATARVERTACAVDVQGARQTATSSPTGGARQALHDLVNAIRNGADTGFGYCRYCQVEDYPVDEQGHRIMGQDVSGASEWHMDHYEWCPSVLASTALQRVG